MAGACLIAKLETAIEHGKLLHTTKEISTCTFYASFPKEQRSNSVKWEMKGG